MEEWKELLAPCDMPLYKSVKLLHKERGFVVYGEFGSNFFSTKVCFCIDEPQETSGDMLDQLGPLTDFMWCLVEEEEISDDFLTFSETESDREKEGEVIVLYPKVKPVRKKRSKKEKAA